MPQAAMLACAAANESVVGLAARQQWAEDWRGQCSRAALAHQDGAQQDAVQRDGAPVPRLPVSVNPKGRRSQRDVARKDDSRYSDMARLCQDGDS